MNSLLDSLLNLAGITVEGYQQIEDYNFFQLKLLSHGTHCPHCQQYTQELHQTTYLLVRDLPIFGQPVYLRVPRRRFYCRRCQRYSTERLEFIKWRQVYTQRYEQHIYQRVLASSPEEVSREEGLSKEEVKAIFRRLNYSHSKNDCEMSND